MKVFTRRTKHEVSKDGQPRKIYEENAKKGNFKGKGVEMPDLSRNGFRCQEKVRNQIERRRN